MQPLGVIQCFDVADVSVTCR